MLSVATPVPENSVAIWVAVPPWRDDGREAKGPRNQSLCDGRRKPGIRPLDGSSRLDPSGHSRFEIPHRSTFPPRLMCYCHSCHRSPETSAAVIVMDTRPREGAPMLRLEATRVHHAPRRCGGVAMQCIRPRNPLSDRLLVSCGGPHSSGSRAEHISKSC